MLGLPELVTPPAHPTVMLQSKHGPCHHEKMAEILKI
jgi:hypothetical protein